MPLPILQPSTYETTHVRGNVTVDSSAMIAMGVILNATPGNKIVIHGGVCLGMGTVITAYDGDIEIKPNAILGAGCLVFGHCVIGSQASLGASVTVYNINVDAGDVISAGSIRGDRTRQIEVNTQEDIDQERHRGIGKKQDEFLKDSSDSNPKHQENNQQEKEQSQETKQSQDNSTSQEIKSEKEDNIPKKEEKLTSEEQLKEDVWRGETTPNNDQVVGKVYINKLLFTLFPERNM